MMVEKCDINEMFSSTNDKSFSFLEQNVNNDKKSGNDDTDLPDQKAS